MSRRRLFGTLCGLVFLVNLARIVFAPLVAEFVDTLGVAEGTAGLVVSLVWVGSALPRLPTGWLLTRVPRHHVVVGAGVVLTAASALTATADGFGTLAAGALAMGLASGVYLVAANPLVSELFPDRVGAAMGVHGTAAQLAAVGAAPLVTAVLLVAPWPAVFVVLAVASLAVTVALVLTSRTAALPEAGGADRDLLGAARAQWRLILVGVAVVGCTGFVWQGVFNFFELYLRAEGVAPVTARNLLTVLFAAGVPAFFLSGRLADRLPYVPYLLAVMTAFVAAVLVLVAVDGLPALVVVAAGLGYVVHSLFPALDAYLLESLPDVHRGSAYAVYSGVMMLFQAGGSWVVGSLVESGLAYGTVFTSLAVGLAGVVACLAGLWLAGRLPTPASTRARFG